MALHGAVVLAEPRRVELDAGPASLLACDDAEEAHGGRVRLRLERNGDSIPELQHRPSRGAKLLLPQTMSLIVASTPSAGVLLLSLARAPVNAVNDAMWHAIKTVFDSASTDPDVRCVVLASAFPRVFTAGLDLAESSLASMRASDPARTALLLKEHIQDLQTCVSAIQHCAKPVVAAVHGLCLGAGIDLISAADIRCAASNAVFSIKEVDVGLAADVGTLQRLPRKTGNDSLLRELALTARNFGAVEAQALGLVSKVVEGGQEEVLAVALELANVIACSSHLCCTRARTDSSTAKSPVATLGTKHLLNYSQDHTVQEGLDYTTIWYVPPSPAHLLMLAAGTWPCCKQRTSLTLSSRKCPRPSRTAADPRRFKTKKPATFKKMGKL